MVILIIWVTMAIINIWALWEDIEDPMEDYRHIFTDAFIKGLYLATLTLLAPYIFIRYTIPELFTQVITWWEVRKINKKVNKNN